jgi:putative FmdB family regulatory protein
VPKYTFECQECSVRFERNLKIAVHSEHECPSCHDPAPLVVEGFGFSFAEGSGAAANSGVHSQDYPTADQAVGRSAEKRWAHIRERDLVKQEARKQGGTHALIRRHGPGYVDYEPMSDKGRGARRKLAKEALKAVSEGKKAQGQ